MTRLLRYVPHSGSPSGRFASAQDVPAEYQQVLTTLDRQGDYKANVLKVNVPRNDLSYWGNGPAEKLATGFKAALAELGKSSKPTAAKH
jgi:hypothetical protein